MFAVSTREWGTNSDGVCKQIINYSFACRSYKSSIRSLPAYQTTFFCDVIMISVESNCLSYPSMLSKTFDSSFLSLQLRFIRFCILILHKNSTWVIFICLVVLICFATELKTAKNIQLFFKYTLQLSTKNSKRS